MSTLLYGCTTWTLSECIERKSLTVIAQECYELYWTNPGSNIPQAATVRPPTSISKTIQIRRTRHVGRCWRSKDEHISDVLPWTSSHGRASVGRPTRTYIQWLRMDTGCSLEGLPNAMGGRDEWQERERVREIQLHPPTIVYHMTLNNLMVRLQQCWSFGECHCSQAHSGSEW